MSMDFGTIMKRLSLNVLLLIILPAGASVAGEIKVLELTDGSILTGEVLSLSNGLYTVRTDAMGTVTVPDSKIKAIRARDAAGTSSTGPAAAGAGEIKALTDRMLADQDTMAMIESLKDDPEFTSILQDPQIMNAVQNNDIAALMANPKFLKLMNNATVRNIQKKVAQ